MSSRVASRSSVNFPAASAECTSPNSKVSKRVTFADALEDTSRPTNSQPAHRGNVNPSTTGPSGVGSTNARTTSESNKGATNMPALLRAMRARVGSTASVSSVETVRGESTPVSKIISRPRPLAPTKPKEKEVHARDHSAHKVQSDYGGRTDRRAPRREQTEPTVEELIAEQLKRKRADSSTLPTSFYSSRKTDGRTLDAELARATANRPGLPDAEKHRTVHLPKKTRRAVVGTLFRRSKGIKQAAEAPLKAKEVERRVASTDILPRLINQLQSRIPRLSIPRSPNVVLAAQSLPVQATSPIVDRDAAAKLKAALFIPFSPAYNEESALTRPTKLLMRLPSFPPLPAVAPVWKAVPPELATPTDDSPPQYALTIVGAHTEFWDGENGDTFAYHGYLLLGVLPCPDDIPKADPLRLKDAPELMCAELHCYVAPERRGSLALPGVVKPGDFDTSFHSHTRVLDKDYKPEDITLAGEWELAYPTSRIASDNDSTATRAVGGASVTPKGWRRKFTIPLPIDLFTSPTRQFTLRAQLTLAVELGIGEGVNDWGDIVKVDVSNETRFTVGRVVSTRDITPGFVEIDGEKRRREANNRVQRVRYEAEMAEMVAKGEVL